MKELKICTVFTFIVIITFIQKISTIHFHLNEETLKSFSLNFDDLEPLLEYINNI